MQKFVFSEILKVGCFSRHLLERNYMCGSISIENISFSRNCDIKITNAKSVTDATIWVMFISKNSDTLEIAEHSLFKGPNRQNAISVMPTAHYTTRRDTTRRDNPRQENRVMCGGLRHDATRQHKNRASS